MTAVMLVGLGGFLGAVGRYLLSLLPFPSAFPLATLLTNLIGSILIGAVTELFSPAGPCPSSHWLLFLRTGLCGGFTTFSTFSLETFTLLEDGRTAAGAAYAFSSLAVCLAGVWLGRLLVKVGLTRLRPQ